MNGAQVGALVRERTGALSFAYARAWLDRESAFPISRRFSLTPESYVGKPVSDYFDNLLPDDRRVRERVAARSEAKGTQAFDLLAAIGRDCVGALQFYPEGEEPGPVGLARGEAVSEGDIAEMIRGLHMSPLGIGADKDFRISLAGAQSKTALLRHEGTWILPKGATPTTHILKPAIGQVPDGPDLSLSVENEWLCLKLLEAFGIPVAAAEIVEFEDVKALVVERFDRRWADGRLYRLPQEDFCQALGFGPESKYEAEGGPGIRDILALLDESDDRDADRRIFMKSQLVFWLLAAIDGHAKNFSWFIRPSGFALTPLYDVMSADPHVNPKTLPDQKIKLAMAVGKGRHYKVNEILPRHWEQTAAIAKFAGIEDLTVEVATAASSAIETVARLLPKGFPARVSGPVFEGARARAARLAP